MDEILHHFEGIGNHCLLVFTGESSETRVSERWRRMDFATIHSSESKRGRCPQPKKGGGGGGGEGVQYFWNCPEGRGFL